jgi:hypothetical protein
VDLAHEPVDVVEGDARRRREAPSVAFAQTFRRRRDEVRDPREPAPNSKSSTPTSIVSTCDSFDASSSAVLRELDESKRFV